MWRFVLNLLLPQPPRIAQLEAMSAADFRAALPPPPVGGPFQPQEWVLALFPYEHPLVKTAVWEVKYRGNRSVARLMGVLLAEELTWWLTELTETENFRAPLLVPIPLAHTRERERGFNQCILLAREMLHLLGEEVELRADMLIKTRETQSQAKTENRAERIQNLRGTFAVREITAVAGRNVVLLDDVTTTGATLGEARKTLQKAGARRVIAITIAH